MGREYHQEGRRDMEENMERSWGDSDAAESSTRSTESPSIVHSGFRFRLSSSSDAMSLQSGGTSPLTSGRFSVAALRRSHGGEQTGGEAHEYEEEYGDEEEEEEDDDDHMRRSWTTEKEPVAMRFRLERGHTAQEMKEESERGEEEEEEHEEEDGHEEDEDEEDDQDDSFGSMEWWVREQRHLQRQEMQTADHQEDGGEEGESKRHGKVEDSVEESVREALSLLNGNDAEEEQLHESWSQSGAETAERRSSHYFDIVQEAMVTEWTRGRTYTDEEEQEEEQHEEDQKEHHEEEREEEQEEATTGSTPQIEQEADEWLEAFTAKGRVYYYNRRTRESSWTKPLSVVEQEAAAGETHEAEESEEELQDEEEDREQQQIEGDGLADDDDGEEDIEAHERHSFQASLRSSTSSTASSENQQAHEESFHSLQSSARVADSLFCCFCGSPVRGAHGFQFHFSRCETLLHHKLHVSPLYEQFQQMLVLLSEDSTLRAMHYASSFPDARPQQYDVAEPTQQSVRESLVLLRVKHRSSVKPLVHKTPETDRVPLFQSPAGETSRGRTTTGSSRKATSSAAAAARESTASRYNNLKQKPVPVAMLNMETCRHCSRSFAEGRLAKHEAVCPRVFGNETSWGRGAAAPAAKQSTAGEYGSLSQHQQVQQRQDMLRTIQKKRNASLKHTLALSFQEHQASLVECPCCKRKFAPSGAQQHIDICKTVQHRPRNHVPLMKDYAMAS